jgi:hypothetical protein
MPHLALGKIDKIKVSTPLSEKTFYLCPFIVKKTKMVLKQNQPLQYDTTFFKGCPTFGESNNLRKLIKNLSVGGIRSLKDQNKKSDFTLSNITDNKMEYIHTDQCNYNDFCDWIWASCNYTIHEFAFKKWMSIC